ncbi:tyrosine--tRNA ligase, mitochondrial-like [Paramacrobiotus metropolitanus]|uniref:tyrosine--tRNA ligase, mitochondrial-like n=1 Tax=Paramacrobiotus metropolitanus TaxID=2943436 RepID=UPI0024462FEE|nr:tyrosine--tRNA ligase, mitochondrial-like [Paramacrobiotus metropolitanus]
MDFGRRILQLSNQQRRCIIRTCRRCYVSMNLPALNARGVLSNVFPEINKKVEERLFRRQGAIYAGFDPTADSLHVGNLLPLIGLLHFQRAGIRPIVLIGGATAKIGDPSGKTAEREGLSPDVVQQNIIGIGRSIETIFANHEAFLWKNHKDALPSVCILNNYEWYRNMNVVDFLGSIGRHFRMGTMLTRESVQTRLKTQSSMSFTEFTYQVFQGYDWYHLFQNSELECWYQLGGNDQLGNMVAGYEIIRRKTGSDKPFCFTVPLITNEAGDKFGKTAGNPVWLNEDKLSAYEFYQFFLRLPDSEVEKFLRLYTFLPEAEIVSIMEAHKDKPELRKAQKKIAEQVTLLAHGEKGLDIARKGTEAFFNSNAIALAGLDAETIATIFGKAFVSYLTVHPGMTVWDAVMKAKCFGNEDDARRIIDAGGLYINYRRAQNPQQILIPGEHILPNNITLIRVGKKNYYVIRWNT